VNKFQTAEVEQLENGEAWARKLEAKDKERAAMVFLSGIGALCASLGNVAEAIREAIDRL
jgi:hypothetical protein